MNILACGIVIKRSCGLFEFGYWSLEGIDSPDELTPEDMNRMIAKAKECDAYIENDEMSVPEFYRLRVAKAKEEVFRIGLIKWKGENT